MYEARFLGGASLRLDDTPVAGPAAHRHPLALLAILAAHPVAEVTRDKLIAFLWPERDASHGRHLLSEALYVLRNAAGREAIQAVGNGLALNEDLLWTDVRAFSEARRAGDHLSAVEVYGGPFLDGFHVRDGGEFELWMDARRTHLAVQYTESLDALADDAKASGSELEAVHWLRLRLAHDPFSGSSTRRLMTTLVQAGDRAEAIRVGREYESRLRDELDLPPAEEILRLRTRLEGPRWISPTRWFPRAEPKPRPQRSGWSTGSLRERRRNPRATPTSTVDGFDASSAPVVESGVAAPRRLGIGGWLKVLGVGLGPLLMVGAVAIVAAAYALWPTHASPENGGGAYRVVVLPFSACCSQALTTEAERVAVTLADTLTRIPGHAPLDPSRVLTAWRDRHPSWENSAEMERFAAGFGAERYVTGSLIQLGESEVRVNLTLREVGQTPALYTRHGSGTLEGVRPLIENLAGGLAEYLRGEAVGRGFAGSDAPLPAKPHLPRAASNPTP